jgi:hypothetical protein
VRVTTACDASISDGATAGPRAEPIATAANAIRKPQKTDGHFAMRSPDAGVPIRAAHRFTAGKSHDIKSQRSFVSVDETAFAAERHLA